MKTYISNPERMENIIREMIQEQRILVKNSDDFIFTILSENCLKELSTDEVTVLAARLEDYTTYQSRNLDGYAKLNKPIIAEDDSLHVETIYIHFVFHIYDSDRIWNYVSYINPFYIPTKEEMKNDLDNASDADFLMNHTVWGQDGIYNWMPTKSLTGDALTRRMFSKNLQSVSRKYKWGQEARKIMKNKKKG